MPHLVFVGVFCALLLFISRTIYLIFLHPLSQYPGPKLWAATRLPWAYHIIKGDLWPLLDRFHDVYGPVIRIAPDELTYTEPRAWKEIYNAKPDLIKDPYGQTPPLNGADSLFTASGTDHRRIRGAFVHAFSDKALIEQSSIIEPYATQFIERLRRECSTGPINIQEVFGYAAFDIISDLTWGESMAALQSTSKQDWNEKFFLHAKFSTVRNCLSRYSPLDKILQYWFLRVTASQRAANNQLTWDRIHRRLARGPSRPDFMTAVLGRISENGGPKGITKSEVLTNGVAVVVANSQLSAIAFTAAVYFLLCNPVAYTRLTEEIRGESFVKEEGEISIASTARLQYLDAVINETLRLHHPTPGTLPRVASEKGVVIHDKMVPGGTIVGVSLANIHTRPENFHRPREFRPERFLDRTDPRYEAAFSGDCLEAFKPFSTGPRNCIGNRLFLSEARLLLARLLWAFDIAMADANASTWLDQKAWLVYEPKALYVKLVPVSR